MQSSKYIIIITVLLLASDVFSQLPIHKQWENIYGTADMDNPDKLFDLGNGNYAASGFVNGGQNREDYGHWFGFDQTGNEIISGGTNVTIEDLVLSANKEYVFGYRGVCRQNFKKNFKDFNLTILDSTGAIKTNCFGTYGDEYLMRFMNLNSNGYLLLGDKDSNDPDSLYSQSKGSYDAWFVKTDNEGLLEWEMSIGGSNYDGVAYANQLDDSTVIAAIYSYSNDSDFAFLENENAERFLVFVEINVNGKIKYLSQLLFTDLSQQTTVSSNSLIIGDYFYLAGPVGFGAGTNGELIKINYKDGTVAYKKTYGGSDFDGFFNIYGRENGNLVLGGKSKSTDGDLQGKNSPFNTWIMEVDTAGNIVDQIFPLGRGTAGSFYDFLLTDEEEIIVLSANGSKENFPEHYGPFDHEIPTDFYIYKLGYNPVSSISDKEGFQGSSAYPNPNNTGILNTNLKANYSLLDIQGRTLKSFVQSDALDISDVQSGTYLLKYESGATVRIVVE
ncbi:T9SS type A sorting domain-containing protein [Luteibaculum oceani]|uniref:T9SS type A sorting domain-containing protein n=1 Tax=Luteibaculum oceani TaxID=1294296 RepID=A0A5C6UYL6_9FLAO|nr:T9SS type A sorting domain-containing protein [Luteibaculum oceani]TXC78573.1 T9SS type A sorting domain-containing protein [Luteibaculum oceani]